MSLKCILQGQDSKNLATKVELNEHIADKNNPHEVTAKQIGAFYSLGGVVNEDLLAWADAQDCGGSFFINPAETTINVPEVRWWTGSLELNGAGKCLTLISGEGSTEFMWINATSSGNWIGWHRVAMIDYLCNPNLLDNWYFGDPVN